MVLNEEILKHALVGGTILGGGGGGSREEGLLLGQEALKYGTPELMPLEVLKEDDIVVTVSAVGAPAAKDKYITGDDYVKTIELLKKISGKNIAGIITNENGGIATINGWLQSAKLGIPLIDAPCNGRAHPTGVMGSIGLHSLENYITCQAAVGGSKEKDMYTEIMVKGSIDNTARLVRQAAIGAGGLVAVARNPVDVKYLRKNAAIGGIQHAIELGKTFYEGLEESPERAVKNVVEILNGVVLTEGMIRRFNLNTSGGFDVGSLWVNEYELTFWNEYMTAEADGKRIATFPDLIMTFDKKTGFPVTSAEISNGQEIIIIKADKSNLKLGSGMKDKKLFEDVEKILNRDIIKYIF
jgi:DUF917 family protein